MKSRMFSFVHTTWNPIGGTCPYGCKYCWARKLAKQRNMQKYFGNTRLIEHELKRTFEPGKVVFVGSMRDIFSEDVPIDYLHKILDVVKRNPKTYFLFLTKNPLRYEEILAILPRNVILGVTLETNRDYKVTKAPSPEERYFTFAPLVWMKKFVSIEPIMDFDLDVFSNWLLDVFPKLMMVAIGYDNYGNNLPEPSLEKTTALIRKLENANIKVIRKTLREGGVEQP